MEKENTKMTELIQELTSQLTMTSKTFGKKSRPRELDPGMNQLLSWNSPKATTHEPKKRGISYTQTKLSKDAFTNTSLLQKLKHLMAKHGQYSTESHDSFGRFNEQELVRLAMESGLVGQMGQKGIASGQKQKEELASLMENSNGIPFQNKSPLEYKSEHFAKLLEPEKKEESPKSAANGPNEDLPIEVVLFREDLLRCDNETEKKIKILKFIKECEDLGFAKNILEEEIEKKSEMVQGLSRPEKQSSEEQKGDNIDLKFEKKKVKEEENTSNVKQIESGKKKKLRRSKKAQKKTKREKQVEKLVEKFRQESRWLPDSAFQTYFGKPAFAVYGNGNTNPVFGGTMYGNYLKTHNINPQRGANKPALEQVYQSAALASKKIKYGRNYVPLKKLYSDLELTDRELEQQKSRLKFVCTPQNEVPSLGRIHRPDLTKEKRFHASQTEKIQKKPRIQRVKAKAKKARKKENQKKGHLEDVLPKKNKKGILVQKKENITYNKRAYLKSQKFGKVKENQKENVSNGSDGPQLKRTLKKFELDPRNYKNVGSKELKQIPFAGKSTKN